MSEERNHVESPDHWTWTELGEVVERMANGTSTDQNDEGKGLPVSRIETISDGSIDFDKVKHIEDPSDDLIDKYLLRKGDILLSHINTGLHLCKTGLYDHEKPLLHGMNLTLLRPRESVVVPRFLDYLIDHYRRSGVFLSYAQHAVNQSSLNQDTLSSIEVPLPPLSEQRRIVAKIEELFSNLDAGISDLQTAEQQLERYRLSVLQAAVEGRLTADWRETHDPEPADQLLERILGKRENSSYVRKPSLEEFEDGVPSEIPDDWTWTRVGAVCYVRGGKAFRSKNYEDEGIPLVRISNIEDRKVSFEEDTVYLPLSFAEEHGRYLMKEGDIVIAMSGATTGKLGVFEDDDDSALLNQRVGRFEFFDHDLISEDYFFYFLLTIQDNILKEAYGAAQPNISATAISNFALPLPPLQEQNQIASEVERLLSVADDAAATANRENTRAERLRQSILKQAFSGRLVPHGDGEVPTLPDGSTTATGGSEDQPSTSTSGDGRGDDLLDGIDESKQIEMDL